MFLCGAAQHCFCSLLLMHFPLLLFISDIKRISQTLYTEAGSTCEGQRRKQHCIFFTDTAQRSREVLNAHHPWTCSPFPTGNPQQGLLDPYIPTVSEGCLSPLPPFQLTLPYGFQQGTVSHTLLPHLLPQVYKIQIHPAPLSRTVITLLQKRCHRTGEGTGNMSNCSNPRVGSGEGFIFGALYVLEALTWIAQNSPVSSDLRI